MEHEVREFQRMTGTEFQIQSTNCWLLFLLIYHSNLWLLSCLIVLLWCREAGSNHRHKDFQSSALYRLSYPGNLQSIILPQFMCTNQCSIWRGVPSSCFVVPTIQMGLHTVIVAPYGGTLFVGQCWGRINKLNI